MDSSDSLNGFVLHKHICTGLLQRAGRFVSGIVVFSSLMVVDRAILRQLVFLFVKSNALKTFFSDINSIIMKMVDNKLFTISHGNRKVEFNR